MSNSNEIRWTSSIANVARQKKLTTMKVTMTTKYAIQFNTLNSMRQEYDGNDGYCNVYFSNWRIKWEQDNEKKNCVSKIAYLRMEAIPMNGMSFIYDFNWD